MTSPVVKVSHLLIPTYSTRFYVVSGKYHTIPSNYQNILCYQLSRYIAKRTMRVWFQLPAPSSQLITASFLAFISFIISSILLKWPLGNLPKVSEEVSVNPLTLKEEVPVNPLTLLLYSNANNISVVFNFYKKNEKLWKRYFSHFNFQDFWNKIHLNIEFSWKLSYRKRNKYTHWPPHD